MPVSSYGTAGQPLASPSLASWAASVSTALNGSDTPVNTRIGANLVTANQASFETDTSGWGASNVTNPTLARSTVDFLTGSASLLVTMTTTTSGYTVNFPNTSTGLIQTYGAPVVAGRTYTANVYVKAASWTAGRTMTLAMYWYTSGGGYISNTGTTASITPSTTAWTRLMINGVAPATAAYGLLFIQTAGTGSIGDAFYLDKTGIWEGVGGDWVLPGDLQVPNRGFYVDESVGRRVFTWDSINSRWQMTYGDTGNRILTASLLTANGFTTASWIGIRRVGSTVYFNAVGLTRTSAGAGNFVAIPSGFQPFGYGAYGRSYTNNQFYVSGGVAYTNMTTASDAGLSISYQTTDAWPTSLPGTSDGSIPQ